MPVWLVIMIAGATGCGWVFLKAKGMEASSTLKKIGGGGSKTVKKAAKKATGDIGMPPLEPCEINTSREQINFSQDMPSVMAKLEELRRNYKSG